MIVYRIVQASGVAMQLKRPIILMQMEMALVVVIQVYIVMLLFQMDGLQIIMIQMMIVSPTNMTVRVYVMVKLL